MFTRKSRARSPIGNEEEWGEHGRSASQRSASCPQDNLDKDISIRCINTSEKSPFNGQSHKFSSLVLEIYKQSFVEQLYQSIKQTLCSDNSIKQCYFLHFALNNSLDIIFFPHSLNIICAFFGTFRPEQYQIEMIANRQAYEQQSLTIKVKNKFINLLFQNRQIEQVTYHKTIICFMAIFFIFLGFSIFFFIEVSQVIEIKKKYYSPSDNSCSIGDNCTIDFKITKYMSQPVYFMYELGNFYQNHRRYIQSKSNYQLAGSLIDSTQATTCYPYITNADMKVQYSWGNTLLDPNAIASPCGSIALTFFNDTYELISGSSTISIDQTGISWSGDKGGKYKRSINSSDLQWIDPQDEHFIVWMRTSGLPNFKKPWGRINQDLPPGDYSVRVTNNYNSKGWDGDRYFYLTTLSLIGGKNYLLPITFCIIAFLDLAAVVFFCRRFRALKNIVKLKS